MRIFILAIIISLAFLSVPTAYAESILVVQSYKIKPYDDALKGFKSACSGKTANIVYNELGRSGDIFKAVRRTRPALILAIGMEALAKAITIKNIPIVYVMVLNPHLVVHGETNVTGVSMNISPEKHFSILHKLLPSVKTVGVLYDPRRNGPYVKKAYSIARTEGIELLAREVSSPKDIPEALENLRGKIDLLWVLPDITVITPDTTDFLLLFALKNNVPVHTFSCKYLDMGAFSSLEPEPFEMGKQAGEMASRIFAGAEVTQVEKMYASNPQLSVNLKVSKKLGLSVNSQILRKAVTIRGK